MFEKLSERYTKIFEREIPVVSCDKTVIDDACAPGFYDGWFIVKNTGGGNLEGDVFADSSLISLSTRLIEGNDSIVEYEIDLKEKHPGETFESRIVITTSGGQLIIPVYIGISQYGVKCGRFKIHNLQDFAGCVRAIPEESAALFSTSEFEEWLINIDCEHMDFYRKLAGGSVGIREMDSFLTACGVKEKAAVRAKNDRVTVAVPANSEEICASVMLSAVSWGLIEYRVSIEADAPWLRLGSDTVTSAAFEKPELPFEFYIERVKMPGEHAFGTIVFESVSDVFRVSITAKLQKPFEAALSRHSYKSEDSGYLKIKNNTDKSIMLEIAAIESFVRFKAAKYMVEKTAEIPFEIKVNSFLNLGIGKKPVNVSDIICRTVVDGKPYKDTLTVKAGSLISG